jgi:RHS repeat-associated protein
VRYHYGPSRIQQEIVRDGRETDEFFFHPDRLDSTVLLTDNAGRKRAGYRYDAWGNLDDRTGDVPNRFLFTGEEQQPDTELYYLRARWYDPSVSRFLSRDPLQGVDVAPRRGTFAGVPSPFGGVPGVPAALNGTAVPPGNANAYLYVSNNPVNFVDPAGAFSIKGAFKSAWNGVKSAATSPVGRFVIKVAVGTVIQAGVTAAFGGTPLGIVVGGFLAGVTTSLIDRALTGESFSLSRVILQDVVVGGGLGALTAWAPFLPGAPTKYIPYDPIDIIAGRALAALFTPFFRHAVDPDWSPGLEVRSSPLNGGLPGIPPVVGGVGK